VGALAAWCSVLAACVQSARAVCATRRCARRNVVYVAQLRKRHKTAIRDFRVAQQAKLGAASRRRTGLAAGFFAPAAALSGSPDFSVSS
jgi:hypothetical protein